MKDYISSLILFFESLLQDILGVQKYNDKNIDVTLSYVCKKTVLKHKLNDNLLKHFLLFFC